MTAGTLNLGRSVQLDGSGNGSVQFVSDNANQAWKVTNLSVYTANTTPPVPVAGIYLNGTGSVANQQGAAWSGNRASAACNIEVGSCDTLIIQWTGGNPGDTATAVLSGTFTTRRI